MLIRKDLFMVGKLYLYLLFKLSLKCWKIFYYFTIENLNVFDFTFSQK